MNILQKEGYIFPTVQTVMNKHKLVCSVRKTHLYVRAEYSEQGELGGNTSLLLLKRAPNKPVLSWPTIKTETKELIVLGVVDGERAKEGMGKETDRRGKSKTEMKIIVSPNDSSISDNSKTITRPP